LIRYVAETGSTNTDLAVRLRGGEQPPEGEWLVADRQFAGRGRQGRNWSDGAGNFMGSTVVHRAATDPPAPSLALMAGLALHEVASLMVPDPTRLRLKWPNDLLHDRAKLAGILLEGVDDTVIVGMGVNLASAPDLSGRETAAFTAFGPAPDRDAFAHALAASFDRELERWRSFGLEPMIRRWQAAGTPPGTPLAVHDTGGKRIPGTFAGLAPDGSLLLRLADGATRAVHAGDVTLA